IRRNIIAQYHWLDYQPELGRLQTRISLFRPPSLKTVQAEKIENDCDELSALCLISYLHHLEYTNLKEIKSLQPFQSLTERYQIAEALGRLESHSIEALLESYDMSNQTIQRIIQILNRSCTDLQLNFQSSREVPTGVMQAIQDRGQYSLLYSLNNEQHILFPNPLLLVQTNTDLSIADDLIEYESDAEWLYQAYLETAKSLALITEADAEINDYNQLQLFFNQHASLQSDEAWPGIQSFHEAFRRLYELFDLLRKIRLEVALDLSYKEMTRPLNMQLQPTSLTASSISPPVSLLRRIPDLDKIFKLFVNRAMQDPEILVHQSSRGDYFFLFRTNLVQAFIEHRSQRNLLHLMAKQNGIEEGIYDFVKQNLNLTEAAKRLQEDLLIAIRRWEEDRRKELLKKERAKKGFFQRIVNWFFSLFGLGIETALDSSSTDTSLLDTQITTKTKPKRIRPAAPMNRRRLVPKQVEKAIEYIERKYDGLIWLDDLVVTLASPNFNSDAVGDILFYDREQRFKEIRPLAKIRRIFVRMENLDNPNWLSSTIHQLENNPGLPHHIALLEYLKKDDES
ncbi:MAG: hypothetical protein H3C43_07970, partial [Leptonema sp. (in: Bacteria)]|nr:hypothetical protein [Leptonema sp. (in: bacteria)]